MDLLLKCIGGVLAALGWIWSLGLIASIAAMVDAAEGQKSKVESRKIGKDKGNE